jgi:hypothetical protein
MKVNTAMITILHPDPFLSFGDPSKELDDEWISICVTISIPQRVSPDIN